MTPELGRRIAFTIGALLVYLVWPASPVAGNRSVFSGALRQHAGERVCEAQLPFVFGGTALLIVVGTILDLEKQVRSEASV